MKKSEQFAINEQVIDYYKHAQALKAEYGEQNANRLYSCSAYVLHYGHNNKVLKSYNTIIAIYDAATNTVYDFLRYVYGYTATSAQHISKFAKYNGGAKILSYKAV